MRLVFTEEEIQKILKREQTSMIRPSAGHSAEAISYGHGIKSYTAIHTWHMDTGRGKLKKGEVYEITTGVDQPTHGKVFIQGIDKDDWLSDHEVKRLGFDTKDEFVAWWDNQHPDRPFAKIGRYWIVHFALKVDDLQQEIRTDKHEVYEVRVDPDKLSDPDYAAQLAQTMLGTLGITPKDNEASLDDESDEE